MGGLYSSGGTGIRRRDEPDGDDFQAHHRQCQDFILLIRLRNVTCSFRSSQEQAIETTEAEAFTYGAD